MILDLLKRHPFATAAWFDRVVAVSFAFPEVVLRSLVQPPLEIDIYQGFGFVTVSLVWTRNLRPAAFPAFCGQNFFLAGYRIFTQFRDPSGRRLRGLQIVRSETDRRLMVSLGNLFTHYRYRRVRVRMEEAHGATRVRTFAADTPTLDLTFRTPEGEARLPESSPFPDWKTARRFAGPMPFTFSPESPDALVVIEGSRQAWVPRPVEAVVREVGLFQEEPFCGAVPLLANAFVVEKVDYRWSRGRIFRTRKAL